MKRMALIPEELLNRYEQRQRLETSPIMTDMIHKDTQMSNILQRDDMTHDQKQKLYNANLERYLELRQQKDTQKPNVRVVGNKEDQEQPQPLQQLPDAVAQNDAFESYGAFEPYENKTRSYHMGQKWTGENRR